MSGHVGFVKDWPFLMPHIIYKSSMNKNSIAQLCFQRKASSDTTLKDSDVVSLPDTKPPDVVATESSSSTNSTSKPISINVPTQTKFRQRTDSKYK